MKAGLNMLNLHKKFHNKRINIFVYKNHTLSIFLLKGVFFKQTKITDHDQFIFFLGRASHNKANKTRIIIYLVMN